MPPLVREIRCPAMIAPCAHMGAPFHEGEGFVPPVALCNTRIRGANYSPSFFLGVRIRSKELSI